MKTDLPTLATNLIDQGLMSLSFSDMNKDQVEELCISVVKNTSAGVMPYLSKGVLNIPAGCPPEYQYWRYDYPESTAILKKVLIDLGATKEILSNYLEEYRR